MIFKGFLQKIEENRSSKKIFWKVLVFIKDVGWGVVILFSNFYDCLFFKIDKRGFWIYSYQIKKGYQIFDKGLAKAILNLLKEDGSKTLVDFGCGLGKYVEYFNQNGIKAVGYDGNPHTERKCRENCFILDLSEKIDLKKKFDWVLSLEVGEHIPPGYENNFIENMANHCLKGIILSWAIIGQRGRGHVNCKDNFYVKKKITNINKKLKNDLKTERELREKSSFACFKSNIMVFRI